MKKYRKPYRVKKKKPIFRNRFFWLGILIFVVIVGIFYLICFSSFFQIKEIKISGNSAFAEASADKQKVSIEDIRNVIEKEVEQKFLFLPSKSIFLINLKEINEIVLEKFPQLAKINLKRSFPDTMLIEIEERKPVAIFCQKENYFFIDGEGIIFEEVFEAAPQWLQIKNLTLAADLKIGEEAIKKEKLSQALEIESKLKDYNPLTTLPLERASNLKILEVSIISEERLNAKTSEGWEIYFNLESDLNWQLTKLGAVLEKEIPPERRESLEYIDLRFGNLAPFKYRAAAR